MSKHHKHPHQHGEPKPSADTDGETSGDETASGISAPADEVTALRQELDAVQAKAADNWNQFLRATAELDNFRKRADRDMAGARKYGIERLAAELLSVRDSLEMGLAAAKSQGQEASAVADGMELTLKQLAAVMERFDIKAIEPGGEAFNPELHQAMTAQESANHAPNTVLQVLQKGYRLHDRLLRPAMVIVSKAPAIPQAESPEELPPGTP